MRKRETATERERVRERVGAKERKRNIAGAI